MNFQIVSWLNIVEICWFHTIQLEKSIISINLQLLTRKFPNFQEKFDLSFKKYHKLVLIYIYIQKPIQLISIEMNWIISIEIIKRKKQTKTINEMEKPKNGQKWRSYNWPKIILPCCGNTAIWHVLHHMTPDFEHTICVVSI